MFGLHYIKAEPTQYMLKYVNGVVQKEGAGASFYYFAPITSIVTVPMASTDVPFIVKEVTQDYQEITVQGQLTYRIVEPRKIAQYLNYTINPYHKTYVTEDPDKLDQRLINVVQVVIRNRVQRMDLRECINAGDEFVVEITNHVKNANEVMALGIEILGLSVLAIKPNPETSRALEAQVREQLLQDADEAIYVRRNFAVEQERAIQENELNTEIAVENKKREIMEAQMDAKQARQEKENRIRKEQLEANVKLEEKNKEFVELKAANKKKEGEAEGYNIRAIMDAYKDINPLILQALASAGMDPGQLVAQAFRELAQNSEKIGQLNITPDLLKELIDGERME